MLDAVIEFVRANEAYIGPIAFALAAIESLAIVGILVPGASMLLALGGLAGVGMIPLAPLLIWAIAGAITGDALSYLFGRWSRQHVETARWLQRWAPHIEQARQFIARHGIASVAMGRFLGPLRAIVPFVAGALGMPPTRYFVANVISAIGWAPLWILPGTTLGVIFKEQGINATLILIAAILMITFIIVYTRKKVRHV
jgi:membrane protein DedA with SNARE-associated domain